VGNKGKEKTKDMNPKLMQVKQTKLAAFDRVVVLATELLQLNSTRTFEIIYTAFAEYEKLAKAEDDFVWKNAREGYTYMYALMMNKTIADVWWRLPVPIRELWMSVPELKAWKDKYV
jgi:hypothetical protein